ncbi:RAB interacting factor STRAT isoform X2 [Megachile rotundata]|uniref:RAB interacting factor STRAT isoform X2 n=1 Tax=Megachile rotundata TaxID=143995 RepID=UPI000614A756|nr:PREDICTED: guanine nucleotide exchange factor MSS4 homolog isoform X2 [Megachile rotundata]
MSTNNDINSLKDENEKNKLKVHCTFCPSEMLNIGAARLVNIQGEDEGDQQESITDYWLVDDIYTFENIGVSHTVDNVKYLACADCERGPVGWHDLSTKKSYIALSRVKHE